MPLPLPSVARKPLHNRSIRVQSYLREDGLFDLEAELLDDKSYDVVSDRQGLQPAGTPVHHMLLRVTVDAEFNIVAAQAKYDAAPYGEGCTVIEPAYGRLVGLNLMRGFRHEVKARLGRTAGCTHMTELTSVLPTAAVQTMAGLPGRERRDADASRRPFQLDGCHALRVDGPMVRQHYPRWYLVPADGAPNPEAVAAKDSPELADSLLSPSSDS